MTTWHPIVGVGDMAGLAGGEFAVAGMTTTAMSGLLRVNASGTSAFAGIPPAHFGSVIRDEAGHLVAAGNTGLYRSDVTATAWTTLAAGSSFAVGQHEDGSYTAALLTASIGETTLVRITPNGTTHLGDLIGTVPTLVGSGHGDLLVVRDIAAVGDVVSVGFAHARPTCPPSVTTSGTGCTGGAGPVALTAGRGPWLGGPFTVHATGMLPSSSLALLLLGVQPTALPLPGGAAGCTLLVQPVLADVFVPAGGVATCTWAVPVVPALVGQTLHAQVVGVEIGLAGISRLTSTNALHAVVGSL